MKKKIYSIEEQCELFGLRDKARDLASQADWFANEHSHTLSEYYRYAHKTVCDYIDTVLAHPELVDVFECIIKEMLYDTFNEYKFYQRKHFEHFAEVAMVKYQTLRALKMHIGYKRSELGIPTFKQLDEINDSDPERTALNAEP